MQRTDDRIAAFGLFLVALTAWGPNPFGSQAYMLAVCGLAALSIMAGDFFVTALGLYLCAWFSWIQSAGVVGMMSSDAVIWGIDAVPLVMAAVALYVVVRNGRASVDFWKNSVCILAVVLAVIGLLQYRNVGEATATLGCTNFLGAFLAVSAVLFYRRGWFFLLPIILWALWLTHTATAIAALCIGTGFYLWRWRGVALAVIPGAIYCIFFKGLDSLFNRAEFWTDAAAKVSANWHTILFGFGPGVPWQADNTLHSVPVYLLFNLGIIGLMLAVGYVATRKYRDRLLSSAVLVLIVNGFANLWTHTPPTAYLAAAIFALNDREATT